MKSRVMQTFVAIYVKQQISRINLTNKASPLHKIKSARNTK